MEEIEQVALEIGIWPMGGVTRSRVPVKHSASITAARMPNSTIVSCHPRVSLP